MISSLPRLWVEHVVIIMAPRNPGNNCQTVICSLSPSNLDLPEYRQHPGALNTPFPSYSSSRHREPLCDHYGFIDREVMPSRVCCLCEGVQISQGTGEERRAKCRRLSPGSCTSITGCLVAWQQWARAENCWTNFAETLPECFTKKFDPVGRRKRASVPIPWPSFCSWVTRRCPPSPQR